MKKEISKALWFNQINQENLLLKFLQDIIMYLSAYWDTPHIVKVFGCITEHQLISKYN